MIRRPASSTLFPCTTLFRYGQGRLGQHLGRLLEAGGADEAVRLHGRLGDPEQLHLAVGRLRHLARRLLLLDRKSTRLNSSHVSISYAVFCLKKKNKKLYTHL